MSFMPNGPSRLAWLRSIIDHRRHLQREVMQPLDAVALRDLAVDRSELTSYLAEARQEAQATRRRVAQLSGTGGGT